MQSFLRDYQAGTVDKFVYYCIIEFVEFLFKNLFVIRNLFKLYVREDDNDWFYAVQSNNALVKLANEGKITKKINMLYYKAFFTNKIKVCQKIKAITDYFRLSLPEHWPREHCYSIFWKS